MPWATGVDSGSELREKLIAFLDAKIKAAPYKARLPRRHYSVIEGRPGLRKVGARIEVWAQADERQPHTYFDPVRQVREDYHRITLDVKGDSKSGGIDVTDALLSVLKSLFSQASTLEELIVLGIYNVRQSSETMQIDGVEFNRPLFLSCNTDVYLN